MDQLDPQPGAQHLCPASIRTLAPSKSQSSLSIKTASPDTPNEPKLLTPARSHSSIRWNEDTITRTPSVSPLPQKEVQEWMPCRDAAAKSSFSSRIAGLRWRAILAVAAGFCQQALSWGFIMVYGSQFTYYEDVLLPGYSRVELSLPGAIAPALLLIFSMFHGRLCDSHYHRYINVGGSILLIAGFFCLTFSSGAGNPGEGNYGIIVLAYVLQGLGQSSFFVTSSHIASSWYPDRPAIPIGITSCGVAVAGIFWPVMFQEGASVWGFRNAIGGMTGLVILLCIFVCIFGMPDPDTPSRPLGPPLKLQTWVDPLALTSFEWIFATGSTCLIYLGLLVIPQFMEDWAMVRGLSTDSDQAVLLLTIAMGCSLIGRLGGSYVAGIFGFRIAHSGFCIAQMVWIFVWWNLATSWSHAIAFAIITGALIGAIITLPPGGMKEIVHKSSPSTTSAEPSASPGSDSEKGKTPVHSDYSSPTTATTNSSTLDLEACANARGARQVERRASMVSAIEAMAVVSQSNKAEQRNVLGQWLGTSFLCAAPFVLTGNLATSRLVAGSGGILLAGWWAGACYGGAGVCLLLSVLATRLDKKSRGSDQH